MENRKIRIKISKKSAFAFKEWWFYALMASESYVKAHAYRQGRLSPEEISKLPWDFGLVLQTYDDFGWVGNITYPDWFKQKNKFLFTVNRMRPAIKKIALIEKGDKGDYEKIVRSLEKYVAADRPYQNSPKSLIVSIPIDMPKQHLYRQLSAKIDLYKSIKREIEDPADIEMPLYCFKANKLKTTAFRSSLKTLKTKIRNPEWPLWKVGTEINLNEDAAIGIQKAEAKREAIVKKTGKRPKPEDSAYEDKMIMNTMVSRQLKYAFLLTENAARGRFPCIDPILGKDKKPIKLTMDYQFMNSEYAIAEAEFYERYPRPEIV